MTRISLLTLLMIGISAVAYAQVPTALGSRIITNPPITPNQPGQPTQTGQSNLRQDYQNIHQDYRTLETDDDEIRAMDRKRDEALRSNNPAAAQAIQAQIDKLRAARKNVKQDIRKDRESIEQQRREAEEKAEEKCARDPACAARKRHEELEHQLQAYNERLASDQAAAARIPQDKDAIAKIEMQLKR